MKTLTLQLPDQTADRIADAAEKHGLTVDALVQASIEEKLQRLELSFDDAARYVVEKNAELYRRLA